MIILIILLVGIFAVGALFVYFTFLSRKKGSKPKAIKEKKDKSKPTQQAKEEQSAKEPDKKLDRGFNVVKKSKVSRVSKKAVTTSSRTGTLEPTIERVFSKDPPLPIAEEPLANDTLSKESEDLMHAVERVAGEEKKIISIAELKEKSDLGLIEQEELEKSLKYEPEEERFISSGRAGEVSGEYSGIGVGIGSRKRPENNSLKPIKTEVDTKLDDDDDFDIESLLRGSFNPERPSFGGFNKRPEPVVKKKTAFDITDAIIAEAMLNPKHKTNKKTKK